MEGGEIRADASYTLKEFSKRAGLGRDGLRSARQKGLQITRAHNRGYVIGRHWMEYLERVGSGQTSQ